MDYNLWQKFMDSNYGKRLAFPINYLTNRPEAEEFMDDEVGRFAEMVMGATSPFRKGANILAQNYGSALTGEDMSQEENQGGFLKWLAGGLTPEEQDTITNKPYLSALKSGAGMASTLAPFGTQGLRAAQFASNPLTNRLAQLGSQGALEGSMGGFGYSREGKEVEDTLLGTGLGIGGEVLADYITNPQFRKMIGDATTVEVPGKTWRGYKGGMGEDVDLDVLRDRAFNSTNVQGTAAGMENMTTGRLLDDIQDDIEIISNSVPTQEGLEYLQEIQRIYGEQLGGAINMPLELYKKSMVDIPINQPLSAVENPYDLNMGPNPDNYARYVDSGSDSSADTLLNTQTQVSGENPGRLTGEDDDLRRQFSELRRRWGIK